MVPRNHQGRNFARSQMLESSKKYSLDKWGGRAGDNSRCIDKKDESEADRCSGDNKCKGSTAETAENEDGCGVKSSSSAATPTA